MNTLSCFILNLITGLSSSLLATLASSSSLGSVMQVFSRSLLPVPFNARDWNWDLLHPEVLYHWAMAPANNCGKSCPACGLPRDISVAVIAGGLLDNVDQTLVRSRALVEFCKQLFWGAQGSEATDSYNFFRKSSWIATFCKTYLWM